jgi:hypothetical protein
MLCVILWIWLYSAATRANLHDATLTLVPSAENKDAGKACLSSLLLPGPETVSHVTGSAGGYCSSVVNRFKSRSTVFCCPCPPEWGSKGGGGSASGQVGWRASFPVLRSLNYSLIQSSAVHVVSRMAWNSGFDSWNRQHYFCSPQRSDRSWGKSHPALCGGFFTFSWK